MNSPVDFGDAEAVRQLQSSGERLVCLEFPEKHDSLYCHSALLSVSSPVLRTVLEDTQHHEQDQPCIPLTGDSDVGVWKLALGLMYHMETAKLTLDNAQALVLLAHKYDMRHITGTTLGKCTMCTLQDRAQQSLSSIVEAKR
jgi:hypothetical protein